MARVPAAAPLAASAAARKRTWAARTAWQQGAQARRPSIASAPWPGPPLLGCNPATAPSAAPSEHPTADLLSIIDVAANERAVLYRERASGQYSAATCGCLQGWLSARCEAVARLQPP